ncbi:hypothetical protein R1sor_006726 [Riccia sorocarpa]|uniref:Phytocyanin domain-containing protein n=1 Tax=Riccia sorocarpa TaxID=122646 RepID=A0ABD3HN99_9MARC
MARQGRGMALLVLVAFGLVAVASATEYPVADGWKIPPTTTYYSDWLADKSFVPGDVLVFEYTAGSHSVLEVTKSKYDTCDTTSPISSHVAGSDKITLGKAGTYYYLCGVPGHCDANQKITITVDAAAAPVGAPSTNSTGTPKASPKAAPAPAKPPSGSASGLHAGGALVLSVVMVFVASLVL